MAGNERRVGTGDLLDEIDRVQHAFDRSAVGLIGKRVAEISIEVLDVDHVGVAEAHDGVSRGVRRHHRNEVHGFPVHVERDGGLTWRGRVVAVRRHRNAGGFRGRCRLAVGAQRRTHQLVPQVLLREEQRSLVDEEGVGSSVVRVHMRVDEHSNGRAGERPDRLQCLVGHLPVFGIHQQDAIRSEERHGPAAGCIGMRRIEAFRAVEHEEVRRHLGRHQDLNLVPRRLVSVGKRVRTLAWRDDLDGIGRLLRPHHRGNSRNRRRTQ